MFEVSEVVRERVDAVYRLLSSLRRGEIATHSAIRQVLGCEAHEADWDYVVFSARRRLERVDGIATWPEYGVGYRLLSQDETLKELPRLRMLKSRRQVARARRSVKALPTKGLTFHQRRMRNFQMESLERSQQEISRQMAQQAAMVRNTPGLPKPREAVAAQTP